MAKHNVRKTQHGGGHGSGHDSGHNKPSKPTPPGRYADWFVGKLPGAAAAKKARERMDEAGKIAHQPPKKKTK